MTTKKQTKTVTENGIEYLVCDLKPKTANAGQNHAIQISDLNTDPPTVYVATSEKDCRDSTDRSAYREAVKLNDVVTMGKVIALPVPSTEQAKLFAKLSFEANARLIVASVNNANKLAEALRGMLKHTLNNADTADSTAWNKWINARVTAEQALANWEASKQ